MVMIKIVALNDLGDEITFVTITDLDIDNKPEEHKLVRSAFRLLNEELIQIGLKD